MICPGSSTTMAQLGCSELTPPSKRFPTRMFWDADATFWRPYRTYTRKKKVEGAMNGDADEEEEIVEDPDSAEGAVYPLRGMFPDVVVLCQRLPVSGAHKLTTLQAAPL